MTYTELFTEVLRAEIELWDSLDTKLVSATGLRLPTFQALSTIDRLQHPVRVQDISAAMSITVGATSKVVDRLERDGYVRRESNPDDRRSSSIVLVERGTESLARAADVAEAHLDAVLSTTYPPMRAAALTSELAQLRVPITADSK